MDLGDRTLELDTGHWKLDTGYWTLDTEYWTLDIGNCILDTGYWTLDSGYWPRLRDFRNWIDETSDGFGKPSSRGRMDSARADLGAGECRHLLHDS
jgi:hypothetical protein